MDGPIHDEIVSFFVHALRFQHRIPVQSTLRGVLDGGFKSRVNHIHVMGFVKSFDNLFCSKE